MRLLFIIALLAVGLVPVAAGGVAPCSTSPSLPSRLFADDFDLDLQGDSFVKLRQWDVIGGVVDVFGPMFLDPLPANGGYAHLGGIARPPGILESRREFCLGPGFYQLSVHLAGSQTIDVDRAHVKLAAIHDEAYVLAAPETFGVRCANIVLTGAAIGKISVWNEGPWDGTGIMVDRVELWSLPTSSREGCL